MMMMHDACVGVHDGTCNALALRAQVSHAAHAGAQQHLPQNVKLSGQTHKSNTQVKHTRQTHKSNTHVKHTRQTHTSNKQVKRATAAHRVNTGGEGVRTL
jgi:hypothetical protein